MPVYEYECKACGKQFEYQQRMSDEDKTLCEACGKEALERIISRTAFALKGGGWYKDLYASTKPEAAKSDKSEASGTTSPASTGDTSSSPTPAAAAPAASTPTTPSTPSTSSTSGGGSGSAGGGTAKS